MPVVGRRDLIIYLLTKQSIVYDKEYEHNVKSIYEVTIGCNDAEKLNNSLVQIYTTILKEKEDFIVELEENSNIIKLQCNKEDDDKQIDKIENIIAEGIQTIVKECDTCSEKDKFNLGLVDENNFSYPGMLRIIKLDSDSRLKKIERKLF